MTPDDADDSAGGTDGVERIDDAPAAEEDDDRGADPATSGTGGGADAERDADADGEPAGEGGRAGRAPFASLVDRLDGRERDRVDAADPFEEMDVPEFDGDVWAALEAGNDGDGAAAAGGDRAERVVNKREYCQQCPRLAAPPALACTLAGADIVEVLEGDDLRVRGCPMVGVDGPGGPSGSN